MVLTYLAVVVGDTPDVVKGVRLGLEQANKERAADRSRQTPAPRRPRTQEA